MKILATFFFGCLLAQVSLAGGRAIVFGGNCESEASNLFVKDMSRVSSGLVGKGWDVKPLFGSALAPQERTNLTGAQANRDSIAKAAGLSGIPPEASKMKLIAALEQAAVDLAEGEQLLLNINTHGSDEASFGAHGWCMDDGSVMPTNDPEFLAALEKVKKKKIKLGVLDASCFGGGSQKHLAKFGCVISTTNGVSPAESLGVTRVLGDLLHDEPKGLAASSDVSGDKKISLDEAFLTLLLRDSRTQSIDTSGNPRPYNLVNQPQMTGFPDFANDPVMKAILPGAGYGAAKDGVVCETVPPGIEKMLIQAESLSSPANTKLLSALAGEPVASSAELAKKIRERYLKIAKDMNAYGENRRKLDAVNDELSGIEFKGELPMPSELEGLQGIKNYGLSSCLDRHFIEAGKIKVDVPGHALPEYRKARSDFTCTPEIYEQKAKEALSDPKATPEKIKSVARALETLDQTILEKFGVEKRKKVTVVTAEIMRLEEEGSVMMKNGMKQSDLLNRDINTLRAHQVLAGRAKVNKDCSDFKL